MRSRTVALAAALVLLLPLAAGLASAHTSDGRIHLMASNDEPRVGELVDFTYFLLEDGELVPHVDTDVTVSRWGEEILHLGSTHEHDGVHRTAVRFVEPGPVTVEVTTDGEDGETATWRGQVVEPDRTVEADVTLDGPSTVRPGETATFRVETVDHTDARVRVYREPDAKLVRRSPLHFHDGEGSFELAQMVPGTYHVRVEAYPGQGGPGFDPTLAAQMLEVEGPLTPPSPSPETPSPLVSQAEPGSDLVVAVDPQTTVGPLADVKLDALLLDGTHPVRHVDYSHTLQGPDGRVILATEQAHAHDGIIEVLAHTPAPGTYTWTVQAKAADGTEATRQVTYRVDPPTDPTGLPGTVEPSLPDAEAGTPADYALDFVDETGEPMEHVEADLEAYPDGEPLPRWTTKLHAHEKRVEWSWTPDRPGAYYLKVNPSPQSPSIEAIRAPGGPLADLGFGMHVAEADAAADAEPEPLTAGQATVPLAPWLAVVALGAAAVLGRRS